MSAQTCKLGNGAQLTGGQGVIASLHTRISLHAFDIQNLAAFSTSLSLIIQVILSFHFPLSSIQHELLSQPSP